MSLELTDSRGGGITKSLPDIILQILSKEHPLTVGQINKIAKREFKVKVTYQAVRKSLLMLSKKKALAQSDGGFSINKEYILEQKKIVDGFLANYFAGEEESLPLYSKNRETHTAYNFETLLQTDKFWCEIVFDWVYGLRPGDDRRFVFHGPHCWYIFGHLGTEHDFVNTLRSNKVSMHYLVDGETPLDEWTRKFYDKNGVIYRINRKKSGAPMRTAMGIFGEYIIQFDYPEGLLREMDEFYVSSKDLRSLSLEKIANTLKKKTPITFILNKNKVVADKLKDEIIEKCGGT
ncbi:MAG: hypothetical protein ABIF01_04235 [Candidatus Micrarchaeota archaeon]